MRKKLGGFFLACLLLVGTGCVPPAETAPEGEPYLLYFLDADLSDSAGGDVFRTETIYLEEGLPVRAQVEMLIEGLLQGPAAEELRSPLPAGTSLLSAQVAGGQATVDFSRSYSNLSGVRLTMADYAVTLTLSQLSDVGVVRITVQGRELAYRDKQSFTARDVLLSSEEDVVGTVEASLYFLNESGGLSEERRTLDLYEGDTQVSAVCRALEGGPETRGLTASLPVGFRVKNALLEEDVCYISLSSALLDGTEEPGALETALQAIGQSLCSLETVGEVRFLVDGELAKTYGGVDISKPISG